MKNKKKLFGFILSVIVPFFGFADDKTNDEIPRIFEEGSYKLYMKVEPSKRFPNGMIEEGVRHVKNNPSEQIWDTQGVKIYKDAGGHMHRQKMTYEYKIFKDLDGKIKCMFIGSSGNHGIGEITYTKDGFVMNISALSELMGKNVDVKWNYVQKGSVYKIDVYYDEDGKNDWKLMRSGTLTKEN